MAAKKAAAKAAKAEEKLAGIPGEEEVNDEAKVSKDTNSIEATGKYEVVEIKPGQFRMFNEMGKAVSGVVSKGDQLEDGRPALAKLIRDSRRANALRAKRMIRTPKGHDEVR